MNTSRPESKRWLFVAETVSGEKFTRDFEEIEDAQDWVETLPDWKTLVNIKITYNL